jgi:outer membrane protein assembly factor BamD
MRRLTFPLALLLLTAGGAQLAGCKSGGIENDPVLRLSSQEALDQGKELMAEEKYHRSRRYLSHAFEVEPNSRSGREGLLLLADSYYLAGNDANWIQAEAKYRDFLNRFPTSDQAAYAQYQIANSLAQRVGRANRDQSATLKALQAFQELKRLYPTSDYAVEADEQVSELRNKLGDAEFVVGDFYLRYRYPAAAVTRFEDLLESYPDYDETDKVLFHLGLAYHRSRAPQHAGKAAEVFNRLKSEYPDSELVDEIPPEAMEAPATPPAEPMDEMAADGDEDASDESTGGEGAS